jgi:hypothetical protein
MLRNRWNQIYFNISNAAVKCTRPGLVRKYDNLKIAKAISGLKNTTVYDKKPISVTASAAHAAVPHYPSSRKRKTLSFYTFEHAH